jgi:hypothetical protein
MREDYKHSRARAYWQERRRLEFMGLMEHEYGEPLPDSEWKRTWDSVEAALTWFFQSPWLERARALHPQQWLEVDEGADHSWFEMDGVKMFAIPDFAFRDHDGHITVVDWKTGLAAHRLRGPGRRLRAVPRAPAPGGAAPDPLPAGVPQRGQEVEVPVDAQTHPALLLKFRESVQRMRELLVNAAANTPLDSAQFPMTEDMSQCARCAFRRGLRTAGA